MDEKTLDKAFDLAVRESADFATWLVSHTKFRGLGARYHWSRSDHPWGRFDWEVTDPATGAKRIEKRDSETDILVVFELPGTRQRFALHVENKLASGSFTEYQPEMYAMRAKAWLGQPKYGSYTDFETLLIAPRGFAEKFPRECGIFDRFIPHEEIARFVPEFAG